MQLSAGRRLNLIVTTLDQSRELESYGVTAPALYYWVRREVSPDVAGWSLSMEPTGEYVPARTTDELLAAFSTHHNLGELILTKCNGGQAYKADMIHWGNLWHNRQEFEDNRVKVPDVSASIRPIDTLYDMLLNCIHEGYLCSVEINENIARYTVRAAIRESRTS